MDYHAGIWALAGTLAGAFVCGLLLLWLIVFCHIP
jgi:hypothetical protein